VVKLGFVTFRESIAYNYNLGIEAFPEYFKNTAKFGKFKSKLRICMAFQPLGWHFNLNKYNF